jgi:hypothetical protein
MLFHSGSDSCDLMNTFQFIPLNCAGVISNVCIQRHFVSSYPTICLNALSIFPYMEPWSPSNILLSLISRSLRTIVLVSINNTSSNHLTDAPLLLTTPIYCSNRSSTAFDGRKALATILPYAPCIVTGIIIDGELPIYLGQFVDNFSVQVLQSKNHSKSNSVQTSMLTSKEKSIILNRAPLYHIQYHSRWFWIIIVYLGSAQRFCRYGTVATSEEGQMLVKQLEGNHMIAI